jgi:hypothetical protein
MTLNILIPTLLGVVITSMINTACFGENPSSSLAVFNWKGICADNPNLLLDGIILRVDVVQ